ncbi:MAG: flavodoxin family protein [Bacteroidota bacterium]
MKRIIGVIGSPRRNGNTDLLVTKILEAAKLEGAVAKAVYLNDLTIKECDGCHVCWNGKPCPKQDDMCNLYPEIIASDVIIFGTPVYWYGPTALMKAFIDRFVYFNIPENRKYVKGKSAVLVIPFEEEDWETVAPVISFFEKSLGYLEMNLIDKIIVPGVSRRGEVLKQETILTKANELGHRLGAT